MDGMLRRSHFPMLLLALALLADVPLAEAKGTPTAPASAPTSGPTVPGDRAALRGDIAYAPANAPAAVKRAIWATNFLRRKPYVWGGGHADFHAPGYDCSGTISYMLHHAGKLDRPAASREFTSYGSSGAGRWITIYARSGHVFAVVAGIRLDTTGTHREEGPRWRPNTRAPHGFVARHPEGL